MNDLENRLVLGHDDPPDWTPDAVLCACGKAEPMPGFDTCEACEVALALADPEQFDDDYDRGAYDSPAGERVVAAVVDERLRRFAAGEAVYPQIRRVG